MKRVRAVEINPTLDVPWALTSGPSGNYVLQLRTEVLTPDVLDVLNDLLDDSPEGWIDPPHQGRDGDPRP